MTRPNCSLTRNHSSIDQPCPPSRTDVRPPCRRAAIAAALDLGDGLVREPAAGELGLLFQRHQHLFARTRGRGLQLELRVGQSVRVGVVVVAGSSSSAPDVRGRRSVERSSSGGSLSIGRRSAGAVGGGGAREDGPAAPASGCGGWRSPRGRGRARCTSGSAERHARRSNRRRRAGSAATGAGRRAAAAARSSRLRPAPRRAKRGARGQRGDRPPAAPLGLGGDRQPCRALDHLAYTTSTEHKVRKRRMTTVAPPTATVSDAPGTALAPACTPIPSCSRPSRS